MADRAAAVGGSWAYLLAFFTAVLSWIGVNAWWLTASRAFDPYPFILLNLVLSLLATVQAPLILMSQRRTEQLDRREAGYDHDVNLRAEAEIRELHAKVDRLLDAMPGGGAATPDHGAEPLR